MGTEPTVLLLHGLGEQAWQMSVLHAFLKLQGFREIIRPTYKVNDVLFEESLDMLDKDLQTLIDKNNTSLFAIGASMGGLLAHSLHRKGWNVQKSVSIGSPLHGAKILHWIPPAASGFFKRKAWDYLREMRRMQPPPHPYKTISMGWFWTQFDGCVFQDEACFDESNHEHFHFADHRLFNLNPRCWYSVLKFLRQEDDHVATNPQ